MSGFWAAVISVIGAAMVALGVLGLRALWSLATELATNRTELRGLRQDTTDNTTAIQDLTRRVNRIDRRGRGGPQF